MARTRATNPTVSCARLKALTNPLKASYGATSPTSPTSGNPSERSVQLLFSIPQFIIAEIFALVLADGLFPNALEIASLFGFVSLTTIITQSKTLRSVCRAWTHHLQDTLFAGLSARSGLLAQISLEWLPEVREIFPMLDHCVLEVGDMMDVNTMEGCLEDLQSHSSILGIVKAIRWGDFSFDYVNNVPHASEQRSTSRNRQMHQYLNYPPLVEVQDYLAEEEAGPNPPSSAEVRDHLVSELMAVQYYHAHLLRNILSCIGSATHVMIPAFIMPILLSGCSHQPVEHSKIQKMLDSMESKGKHIRDILTDTPNVLVVGRPNPFVIYARERSGEEAYEAHRGILIRTYNEIAVTASFPEFLWPSRRMGLHGALELMEPNCKAEWWLRLLGSALSSGRLLSLDITVGVAKGYLVLGPPNFGFRPTTKYHKEPTHVHFCEEFPKLFLEGLSRLDLNLLSICPVFFTNIKKYLPGIRGQWNITSTPQLCGNWVEANPGPGVDQIAEDLAIIEQIMGDAYTSNENLDIRVCFSYVASRLPTSKWKTLELRPMEKRIMYRGSAGSVRRVFPAEQFETEISAETFSSAVRELYGKRKADEFGLFNVLDELAGGEIEQIKNEILSYIRWQP